MIEKGEELAGECMGSFVSHCLSVCPFYGTVTVNINVHTCLALICSSSFFSLSYCVYILAPKYLPAEVQLLYLSLVCF